MLLNIVDYTNLRIRNTISKAEAIIQQSGKFSYMKITDVKEINAFIGLIYYRGLYSLNNHKSHIYFQNAMVYQNSMLVCQGTHCF